MDGSQLSAVDRGYSTILRRRILVVGAAAVATALAFVLDLVTGPSSLAVDVALRALLDPESVTLAQSVIVREVRLPQALMAVFVGAALSLSGAEMQTILQNPLASPFTLGVSAAATLGAALSIVLGVHLPGLGAEWGVPLMAFVFAFSSVLLLQVLARLRGTGVETLVLFGIALVFAFNALVGLIQFVSSEQALQQLVFWSLGSLGRASWTGVQLVGLAVLITFPFSYRARWKMTALRLGEDRARSLGISVNRLRFASLFRISLLAAVAVAFVGTIGFVGLVGPHVARLLVGEDHRFFLPMSALTGGLLLSLASSVSESLVPGAVVPVGIVTALIGVPAFLLLVMGRREGRL